MPFEPFEKFPKPASEGRKQEESVERERSMKEILFGRLREAEKRMKET